MDALFVFGLIFGILLLLILGAGGILLVMASVDGPRRR